MTLKGMLSVQITSFNVLASCWVFNRHWMTTLVGLIMTGKFDRDFKARLALTAICRWGKTASLLRNSLDRWWIALWWIKWSKRVVSDFKLVNLARNYFNKLQNPLNPKIDGILNEIANYTTAIMCTRTLSQVPVKIILLDSISIGFSFSEACSRIKRKQNVSEKISQTALLWTLTSPQQPLEAKIQRNWFSNP